MARTTRTSTGTAARTQPRRGAANKTEQQETTIKQEASSPAPRKRVAPKLKTEPAAKKIKLEEITPPQSDTSPPPASPISTTHSDNNNNTTTTTTTTTTTKPTKAETLQSRKLKSYTQYSQTSPFPNFPHPTPTECKLAHRILSDLHGARIRPATAPVAPTDRAGCGDSPSVLDALVRTILSQNTSDINSTRAKKSMDKAYGHSDNWAAVVEGGQDKLQEAIKCGGLSKVKSKVILNILRETHERYGKYSLDHLHQADSEDAMKEMLSFQGVGPKTASCVLLFCLQRESFAVDTHVWRITGLLGWRPAKASRDETHAHLDVRIPDEDKYGLHILLVSHGKKCEECKAGGRNSGKCELRKAFRKVKTEVDVKDDIKDEEEEIKDEEKTVGVKEEEEEGCL